ncbi:MAG: DUF2284 domain-containing protein [Candidatus Heimdallarchaeota archaeon]|nr:MAG: DUF2284 domain-containing protein [Candidatus Heimdallarchaeota archaeon]
MAFKKDLEQKFIENGFTDFKWINPEKIIVSYWVRMKCIFGCSEYGRNASCPPNTFSVPECEKFFREYKEAAIFHFKKKVEEPEDRFAWTKEINMELLKLEKEVFLSGYVKVFLLFMASCEICQDCTKEREVCKYPKLSRPTPEGMAVDVYSTVRQLNYPIEVIKDYSEVMNRYAFLMIE